MNKSQVPGCGGRFNFKVVPNIYRLFRMELALHHSYRLKFWGGCHIYRKFVFSRLNISRFWRMLCHIKRRLGKFPSKRYYFIRQIFYSYCKYFTPAVLSVRVNTKNKELVPTIRWKILKKRTYCVRKNWWQVMDLPVTSQKKNPAPSMAESRVPKMEQSKCKVKAKLCLGTPWSRMGDWSVAPLILSLGTRWK